MSDTERTVEEVELPIKRTEGETLKERLTDNAYENILPARYLRKDADGELIETQEELFVRIAENIALAEAVFEAEKRGVEVTVTPDQLKPDHPRRDELAEEVFGKGVTADDDAETALSVYNVNKFAYETIVPELPPEIAAVVQEKAEEFQDMMESLSFIPNCVPPDSLVAAGGGMKPLSDVEPGERVYDDVDGNANVEEKYRNGEKLVLEIETDSGYTVRATPEHYFRVIDERGEYAWRQVKELENGDTIALQRNFLDDDGEQPVLGTETHATDGGTSATLPSLGRDRLSIETPETVTPDFAEWLGLYIGDGTARESGVRMAFDDADEDLVEYWSSLTEKIFGFEPTAGPHGEAACIIGRASRRELYDFLEENDLLKDSSKTATVPEAVLRSGRTAVARFLRGLFEADGTVGERSIELYTHSEALASQAQKLLLGLGIRSTIREKRDGYRISIRKNRCGKRFVDQVGFISDRKSGHAKRFETVADSATSLKIPNQTERLLDWYRESDLDHDAYKDLSQFLIDPTSEYHQQIGEELFETYAEKYPELWESPVAEHVERDQFYEPVVSITELGTMAVEDMQVPRRNTYVVEGFVSHNSPTIMNAGDELQQLSACFVDSPGDDITDIHQTMKEAAEVFQCLTEDTTVFVEGKGLVSIADVDPGDDIRGRDGEGHRTRRVKETHAYDDAPVFRVVTEAGIELTGTPNHELFVDDDWSRIDEIEPGDALSLRLGWIPDVDEEAELASVESGARESISASTDAELAAEIGVSPRSVSRYREGQSLEPNGRPAKAVRQPSTLTADLAELVGMWVGDGSIHQDGIRFHLRREETLEHADRLCRDLFDEGLDWQWADGCYNAVLHSHEIKRFWLENFGDAKPDATTASVPQPVRRAGHDVIAGFLRGLYSTDGNLQKGAYPRLWSASAELIDDVQQLLVGLGIPAAAREHDSEERDYYNVGPTGEVALDRFADLVGFVDGRTEEMRSELAEIDHAGTTFGTIDGSTWEVSVERVEAAGTDVVYDVTVEEEPEYVASSVVSHNSGGGMGYAFWKLRPYGDAVGSTGGIASGPITFMRTYDQMCFAPGTKILTPGGTTPIEELDEGQLVIDENGDAQPVTETMERFVDEEIVEITPKRINKPLRVTEEHPFKVVRDDRFEWVDAGDLEEGDRLVLGHWSDENDIAIDGTIDLKEVASGPLVFTDGGVVINREHYGVSKGRPPAAFESEVPTEDFATIAGRYLAEGSIRYQRGVPSTVTFTLSNDERAAAEEIREALNSFGVDSRIREVEDRNTLHVHAEHSSFAGFIEGTFGTGASEKSVPRFLWNAPVAVQARVLETLFEGDGRLEKRGKSQRVQLKLANEEIVDFVFQVGVRCGVQFSRHDRTPEGRQPTYSVGASVSTALGTPLERLFEEVPDGFSPRDRTKQANGREVVAIDSIDRTHYSGSVYNAEVAGTHTYVAEDVVVHNCETIAQGGARRGAQMGVMRVSHPDVIQFIHAKNKDVSLAHSLRLNDPDDYTHNSFKEALAEARELIDEEGRVPKHLRNAVEGHLSNFNISVGVTDDFMEALNEDEEFTFTNPRTGEPHVATPETKELYDMFGLGEYVEVGEVLSVPAAEIWQDIVEGAHENGEPGVIYLERVNKQHSFDVEEHPDHRILATNPCVTGDTLISTESGLIPAEELYEQGVARDVVVDGRLSEDRLKEASSVYRTGEKEVYKLTTEEGYELRLTADHRVMTDDGWVEAADLDAGDTVHIQNRKGAFGRHGSAAEGRVLGWLVGDGHLKDGEERAVLNFYDEDSEISERLAEDVNEVVRDPVGNADYEVGVNEISRSGQTVEQRVRSTRLYEIAEQLELTEQKHQIPNAVMQGSEEMARGFLRALFTADGSVQGSKKNGRSIRLASSHLELLKQTQQLLLNFGIASRIYKNHRPKQTRELPDGNGDTKEYETGAQHELAITKDNQQLFAERIGFLREDKSDQLEENLESYTRGPQSERFTATVENLTSDGYEEVFDLTEPETHSFVGNGLVIHNCGEQPLEEYEACNLGHINLSTLAALDAPDWRAWSAEHEDEYDTQAEAVEAFLAEAIDFEEFDYRIDRGTRFLENVVTMSDFPVEKIEQKVREMRKIGLGIMGLAQLYIQLGVRYGSDAGNEIARQLMTHINHTSKWTSHELATERGPFSDWGDSKYANPTEYAEWFEHHTGLDAEEWEDGFPIRNHNTTTIAPTGTTSMLGNTTGGCEPIYNVAYYKNVTDDVQGDEMLVEFDDYFLRTLEANDIDVEAVKKEAQEQMATNEFDGVEGLSTVPDAIGELFVITEDLSGKQHASVQCASQEGVDSAISKTCNFPNDATVEEMDEVYRYIYDHGGKGVTVYRDGTRSKQVLTTRAKNTDFADESEAAEAIVENIQEVFGGLESFLENDDVREALDAEIEALLESADGDGPRYTERRPRPDSLTGVTQRIDTGYGKMYVTINEDENGEPFELFANIGHSGGFTNSFTEALAKVISTALRSGVDPHEIVDELQGTRSPKVAWDKGEQIQSIPDAIGTAMRRYLDDEIEKGYPQQQRLEEAAGGMSAAVGDVDSDVGDVDSDEETDGGSSLAENGDGTGVGKDDDGVDATQALIDAGESPECPECGSMSLYFSEGCKTCESCGWSEC